MIHAQRGKSHGSMTGPRASKRCGSAVFGHLFILFAALVLSSTAAAQEIRFLPTVTNAQDFPDKTMVGSGHLKCRDFLAMLDDPKRQAEVDSALSWLEGYVSAVNHLDSSVGGAIELPVLLRSRQFLLEQTKAACDRQGPSQQGADGTLLDVAKLVRGAVNGEKRNVLSGRSALPR